MRNERGTIKLAACRRLYLSKYINMQFKQRFTVFL
jgi:hypothetical protein